MNNTQALNAGALGIQKGLADSHRNTALIASAKGESAKPFVGLMRSQRQVKASASVVRTVAKMLGMLDSKV